MAVGTSKAHCAKCNKKCSGEVLKVQDKYFHLDCFKCKVCSSSLALGGFFFKDGDYYCSNDYQKLFGTKCGACGDFVEGEVVTALGNTYHQKCFVCARCRQPFPTGERVTFTGKECLCQKCINIPVVTSQSPQQSPTGVGPMFGCECAGCKEELKEGQALIALDKQWHIWCFKCHACEAVLHGEYMGKDGLPYCERDYQQHFGVKCAHCSRYIAGKVLQAGDNHHFHPTCARCSKCGDPFGDGEEMYLQGTAIWHPRCGPGPNVVTENGQAVDGEREDVVISDMSGQYARISSPGLYRERDYQESPPPRYPEIDITRIYTCSYLTAEPTLGYLKRPLEPRPPKSPQFHRPPDSGRKTPVMRMAGPKPGMKVLVETMQSTTPRPRSPHMNNEEPIELAHFPGAHPPHPKETAKIDRDDFPAPPFPYTDPERRKRWSDSYKGVDISDDEEEPASDDPQLKKEEQELSKIATGIGKVFLQNVKEREKLRQWKMTHLDPRNASRTPSAAREPAYRLRYDNPKNASPSRNMERPRPWEEEEFDRSSSYRSSTGRSVGTIPSYNVVSALRHIPKPGYGLAPQSAMFAYSGRHGGSVGVLPGDYPFEQMDQTHSTEFSSGKSDISASSLIENDKNAVIYPVHLLYTNNYRLPADVDRCHLERHLSNEDFEGIFHMSRMEFYRLPEWRRNDMKRRARLF